MASHRSTRIRGLYHGNPWPASLSLGWIMASDGITLGLPQAFNPDGLEALTTSPDGFNRVATLLSLP